jgi:hypothetical protein
MAEDDIRIATPKQSRASDAGAGIRCSHTRLPAPSRRLGLRHWAQNRVERKRITRGFPSGGHP